MNDPLINLIASIVLPIILVLWGMFIAFEIVAWTGWGVKRWERRHKRGH